MRVGGTPCTTVCSLAESAPEADVPFLIAEHARLHREWDEFAGMHACDGGDEYWRKQWALAEVVRLAGPLAAEVIRAEVEGGAGDRRLCAAQLVSARPSFARGAWAAPAGVRWWPFR